MLPRRPIPLAPMALVLALVVAACSGGGDGKVSPAAPGPPGSIRALQQGAKELSLIGGQGQSQDDAIQMGKSVLTFDLGVGVGELLTGGAPEVYVAKDEMSKALGPFPATWHPFTAYELTGDTSPKTALPGFFAAAIKVPSPGIWTIAAVAETESGKGVGIGHGYVSGDVVGAVGSKAKPVKTPVATTAHGVREICTRRPPDPMHYISLDRALRNGKPTVVTFATPLLCESQLCGPVVDEQLLVYRKFGRARANFIHVEEFLPGPDLKPPSATLENRSKPFFVWKLETEPWTFVIDRGGIIRARFEGPVSADLIESALETLL